FLLLSFLSCRPIHQNKNSIAQKAEDKSEFKLNWFQKSIFMLHEDHHIKVDTEVGKNADPQETARIIALSKPDAIQIHAKGRPGYASYPTKIGWMAPKYERDVLKVWSDIARKDGYHFSIYYNLGRDVEIQTRKPQWNRVNAEGKLQDAALCYHSGVAEDYLWPMIAEIMDNYKPDGLWFDGSVFTIKNCYCKVCKARFLKEKGLVPPTSAGQPGWTAYKDMQRQIYREFLYKTVDKIKAKDPNCLVTINLAYSIHMPEKPYESLDYFTADFGNEFEELSQEAHWYDNQDKPFEIMTTVHLGDSDGKGRQLKPKGQIEQEMATILANGGRYNSWDNPDSKSAISEKMGEHLRDVVSPFLRARQPWILQTKRLPDISFLYSATSHYAATDTLPNAFMNGGYMVPVTDKIWKAGLNYEMLSEYKLDERNVQSKLILVENPAALSESNIKALRKFAELGGTILVTGKGILSESMPGLLGLSKPESLVAETDLQVIGNKQAYIFKHTLYRVQLKEAQILFKAKDSKGLENSLLTNCRVGKGQAMALLVPLLSEEKGKPYKLPTALIKEILEKAIPSEQRLLVSNTPSHVETVLRKKNN
ncbi:MAG: alpha-L-fucosidase, partial [Segetibacter sp.]